MAAYRRVYDSRHLQADVPRTGISSGTLRSAVEYGLPLTFFKENQYSHSGSSRYASQQQARLGCE